MTLIDRSTTHYPFVDAQTPLRTMRIRVLGLTVYRREWLRDGTTVTRLLGVPLYQTDKDSKLNWY
jgi:hypothetical protein